MTFWRRPRSEIADINVMASAASTLESRSIVVCPLGLDSDGRAKVPLRDDYPSLRTDDNETHAWTQAAGLGIVLGEPSGNLAVIDVDDLGLSEFISRHLVAESASPLMVKTARGRLHIYCVEPVPSLPVDLEVKYQGRRCLVQLLAMACVAAAPPTPGYSWLAPRAEPYYGMVGAVWNRIAKDLGLYYREARPYSFLRRERSRGPTTAQIREAARW
jgi:hypothetical protein